MSNSENILLPQNDPISTRSFVKNPVRRGLIRNSLQLIVHRDSSPASSCRIESNFNEGAAEKENMCSIGSGRLLQLNLPTDRENQDLEENDDGFRTPTSLDQKIPAIPACPPPPRKQKPASMKRRAPPRRRVLLDLSNEIELLFPPADLRNNVKKIRQAN